MGEARSGGRHFLVGSIVEVLEKDAGVRLVCTVVPPPRNIEPENEGKLYVRDRALSARRGRSGCLYEFVDVSSVRPTPPPHKASKRFELNDVVEAYYIGGWWEGVVTAVSDGGERFVVTFENPPEPDELRFPPSSLRPLWDWVDGVWTWPQRKGENGALKVGEKVEVSIDFDFDFDFDFRVAWFPAVIVRGNGVYSVELKDKNVECVGIRPPLRF
ncbi:protein AGENET DOMAIN (AGD)-CONTAINING P1-like [Salvia splendens]|uniref:protein AGENET DOMAIN (AGD)-CONTAINING P1-like n=1 Tax=Salvia splendens TaxID=180675 RepID=UPI001C272074|nr:protein AGENET DOMAIN (AGD)-CONTAINING P1-like [Salvia splendens]